MNGYEVDAQRLVRMLETRRNVPGSKLVFYSEIETIELQDESGKCLMFLELADED